MHVITLVEFLPSEHGPGYMGVFNKDMSVSHLVGTAIVHFDEDPDGLIVAKLRENGVEFLSSSARTTYMLSKGRAWLDHWSAIRILVS